MSASFCCCFPVFAVVLYFNYPPSVSLLCVARSGELGVYMSPGLKLNRRTVTHQHLHPLQITADAPSRALRCATCSEPPAPPPTRATHIAPTHTPTESSRALKKNKMPGTSLTTRRAAHNDAPRRALVTKETRLCSKQAGVSPLSALSTAGDETY